MPIKVGERVSAEAAFDFANADKTSSRWPSRGDNNRLEPTYSPNLTPRFRIEQGAKIFTIGSCFARTIERWLLARGFRIPMLDFAVPKTEWSARSNGILNKYTPPNMLQVVRRAMVCDNDWEAVDAETERLLFSSGNDLVIDLELMGFVPVSRQRAIERQREIHNIFVQAFDSDVVIITMGLVECWFHNNTGLAIQSAPATPSMLRAKEQFSFQLLDITEAYNAMAAMIKILMERGKPDKKILLTVSPIPLFATFTGMDVVIANSYGKNMLRTVAQQLYSEFDCVDYFPGYEIVQYSRSPNTWHEDLIHVTEDIVRGVVTVMLENYT
jgi:hypothetical protein